MIDITPHVLEGSAGRAQRAAHGVRRPPPDELTVVLVHDAWADVGSWNKIITLLHAEGVKVLAVRCPLTSLADDVEATLRVLAEAAGPVILVGHGWSGSVITQAGEHPSVAALVYIAALAPDVGQCGGDVIMGYPRPPAFSTVTIDQSGFAYQTLQGVIENLAPDLPLDQARALMVTQGPLAPQATSQKVSIAAWKTRPCWYVVSAQDRVINPDLERSTARRIMAKTTVLSAGHGCLTSHPADVAAVIADAVDAAARRRRHNAYCF